jgi:sodium-dependent dicarboxylate transporter 2/3/5
VWLLDRFSWAVAALLVAMALFVIPLDWKQRRFAMTWEEAAQNIEWGTMALVAGSLALGDLIGDKEIGLGALFNAGISAMAGPETSHYLFTLAVITISVVLTQMTTNVAIVSAMGPIALLVAPALGMNPIALLVTLGLASNIGYCLPSANPPCAIVFASGYVRIVPMFVRGSVLAVIGIVLLSFTGYSVANWVFPWPAPQ